jgi:dTDP-4-dehydrorhamnose 3,5-epimerase
MLPGIVVKPLRRFADERGFFTEIMRSDWADVFQDEVHQANMSFSYPGIVRPGINMSAGRSITFWW